jgi:hypothetical protein
MKHLLENPIAELGLSLVDQNKQSRMKYQTEEPKFKRQRIE